MKITKCSAAAIFLSIAIMTTGCENSTSQEPSPVERPAYKRLSLTSRQSEEITMNNQLAFQLFKSINTNPAHTEVRNKVFSPLSLYAVLSMLANGDDGEPSKEILAALTGNSEASDIQELNDLNSMLLRELPTIDPTTSMFIKNSLWFNQEYSCDEDFKSIFSGVFGGEYYEVDFGDKKSLKNRINSWVEDQTKGLVKDFLDERVLINSTTYLVNTSYFKGTWMEKFPAGKSVKATFHSSEGNQKVTMMHTNDSFDYYDDNQVQAIGLPYGSGNYVMYALLPGKDVNIGEFISRLDMDYIDEIKAKMQSYDVELAFPKFSVTSRLTLMEDDFSDTGIHSIFTEGLSGICKGEIVDVSRFLTQTCISVDEAGTEAATATTVLGYGASNIYKHSAEMTVDRPFVFIIMETSTNAVLYMGRIDNI